jgi:hypothetical protein
MKIQGKWRKTKDNCRETETKQAAPNQAIIHDKEQEL